MDINQTKISSVLKGIGKYAHHHPVVKFMLIFSFFLIYLLFAIFSFGIENGILVALITWSFFVFCTPVADAGLLLDFPLRIMTGIRMIYLEVLVWGVALLINVFAYYTTPSIYSATILTNLFAHIIFQPYPYWSIVFLSAIGTFMSIHFGDEIMDILALEKQKRELYLKHKIKYKAVVFISIIIMTIVLYYFLLNQLGVDIPLI
ncbi:hypothetical protein KKF81_06600 [Candidatus Micrarchaeota archaeon]|nr:hypothetical protein [Candidatus Micrarchaeota archaeon]MBU1166598.1 hypothetical protein [Candidatus Micrarchaeota archaeon]MBU1887270.1 hypothetical protein [Candidatus Micrarchaeota archaeon]